MIFLWYSQLDTFILILRVLIMKNCQRWATGLCVTSTLIWVFGALLTRTFCEQRCTADYATQALWLSCCDVKYGNKQKVLTTVPTCNDHSICVSYHWQCWEDRILKKELLHSAFWETIYVTVLSPGQKANCMVRGCPADQDPALASVSNVGFHQRGWLPSGTGNGQWRVGKSTSLTRLVAFNLIAHIKVPEQSTPHINVTDVQFLSAHADNNFCFKNNEGQ